MLIKRQFFYAFAAVVAALLLAFGAILVMHFQLEKNDDRRAWANNVVKAVFDCNVLGSEAILQETSRATEQYGIAGAHLDRLLSQSVETPELKTYHAEIRALKVRLDALLRDFEKKPRLGVAPLREDFELQSMLVSQWMLQTRTMLDRAQKMRAQSARQAEKLRSLALAVDFSALAVVVLVTGWIFWRSYRTLVTPLQHLSEGARRVGAGDLTHKLAVPEENEIGQAAESFNHMTEQLREREAEVNEKMRDLEAFSYSVAHDLKAPLRTVVGFGGILETDYKEALNEEGRSYVERMRAASLRMSMLIDDLLRFGQLTQRHVDIANIYLKPICQEVLEEMQAEILAANAVVSLADMEWTARGNALLLKQSIVNLVSNAMKFVPQGTQPMIKIRGRRDNEWIVLEIEDNGIGISEEFHQKIFGLFHRLHDYREYPGTGIGLAIVQKSIERIGGKVGVKSGSARGSTFWIQLRPAD